MNIIKKLFSWIFVWVVVMNTASFGITPDRAVIQFNPDSLVGVLYWDYPRSHMTLRVYDSSGNLVPDDTPIAIRVSNDYGSAAGRFFSSQIFKVIEDDPTLPKTTFFWTDAGGQVQAEFAARTNRSIFFSVYAVTFTDPQDPQTAQYQGPSILDTDNSQLLTVINIKEFTIQTNSKTNDEFVFEFVNLEQPESARISLQIFDANGKPVPEMVPVGIFLNYSNLFGKLESDQFFQRGEPGGGTMRNYAFTDENGKVELTYTPANTGSVTLNWTGNQNFGEIPWHFWYDIYGSHYNSEEEAFAEWKKGRTVPILVYTTNMRDTSSLGSLPQKSGELPVLVGPDTYDLQVKGFINGNHLLFTNESIVEGADVTLQIRDDVGRPVPQSTPIGLNNFVYTTDSFCRNPIFGDIISTNQYPVEKVGDRLCGYFGRLVVVRASENGVYPLSVFPPYASLRWEWPQPQYQDPATTNTYYLKPTFVTFVNNGEAYYMTSAENGGPLPILTSPGQVSITFSPSALNTFQIVSQVKIKCTDTRGRPVPPGTTIYASVGKGTLKNFTDQTVEVIIGENGEAVIPYFSPTRGVNDSYDVTITVTKAVRDASAGVGGPFLGEGTLHLSGLAINPFNFSLSKLVFGKTISDVLNDLNPIKVLGSMKKLAETAQRVRAAKGKLARIAGDANASDEEYQQAITAYRQSLQELQQNIGQFILDVPGTVFNPDLPFSAKSAVDDIVEKGFRRYLLDDVKNKFKSTIENNFQDYLRFKKILKQRPNLNLNKYNYQTATLDSTLLNNIRFQLIYLSDLHLLKGESGMMEAYGLQLQFQVDDLAQLDSLIIPAEQSPLGKYFLPPQVTAPLLSSAPAISPGILEITNVDTSTNVVEAVILGIITGDQSLIPEVIVEATAIDTTTTDMTWIDGTRVVFPGNSVNFNPNQLDSVHFFMGKMVPPNPVNEADSLVIQTAYMVGSFTLPDSTIEPVNLQSPVIFTVNRNNLVLDTSASFPLLPYRYDEQQKMWVQLDTLQGFGGDSLAFEITHTAIYGLGGKSNAVIPTAIKPGDLTTSPPQTFALEQNYPNPFNPVTIIRYQLPKAENVQLIVYDILGRRVKVLVNTRQAAGYYTLRFDASDLATGIYFYQLKAGSFSQIRKMLFAK